MPLYNKKISTLLGGVSQQASSVRFDNQADEQINGFSSVSHGLKKRSPVKFRSMLQDFPDDSFIHFVDRDVDEQYMLVVNDGVLQAYDLLGNPLIITDTALDSYLTVPVGKSAKDVLKALTIADSTIIVNTSVEVSMDAGTSPDRPHEALVVIKEGKYGKTYEVKVFDDSGNPTAAASHTTPDGSSSAHTAQIDTAYIAGQLRSALVSSLAAYGNFSVVQEGNIIHIKRTSTGAADFEIATSDGFGDQAMYGIKDSVTLFSDLPRHAPDGFVVAVAGSTDSIITSEYYVRADRNTDISLSGVSFPLVTWEESVASGVLSGFDLSTMPHRFARESNGEFTYETVPFEGRTVGDEESAEDPSFVGDTLSGIFFYANRLGVFSGESVSLSASGDLFNFWPSAVATLLPSDPIDITLNSPKVSVLTHAIPWNDSLVLFSKKHQYILKSSGATTLGGISVEPATDFEVNSLASPVVTGSSVYFANESDEHTEVKEYYVGEAGINKDAANITTHIPTYIPRDVRWLAASGDNKTLVVSSDLDKKTLFVYQYLWRGNEKVQSAWHKYTFEDFEVIKGFFINAKAYLVVRGDNDSVNKLVTLDFSEDLTEGVSPFIIHLDNRMNTLGLSPSYSAVTDLTTYTLPSGITSDNFKVVEGDGSLDVYGDLVPSTLVDPLTLTVSGDRTLDKLYCGIDYSFEYTFGTVYLRHNGLATTTGTTIVNQLVTTFSNTAGFNVVVEIEGRKNPYVFTYTGRTKGSVRNNFGVIKLQDGVFKSTVGSRNDRATIKIVNGDHLPSVIQYVDFTLRYISKQGRQTG